MHLPAIICPYVPSLSCCMYYKEKETSSRDQNELNTIQKLLLSFICKAVDSWLSTPNCHSLSDNI